MSIGAWIGIAVGISLVLLIIFSVIFVYLESRRTYVCDHCGYKFKAKFAELLISPHSMWHIGLTCPKCGECGASVEDKRK